MSLQSLCPTHLKPQEIKPFPSEFYALGLTITSKILFNVCKTILNCNMRDHIPSSNL
jgi:hypothetical protein